MITSKQRAYLRGLANSMEPILQIGKGGISENLVIQVLSLIHILDLLSNYERIADHCSNIGLLIEQEATENKAYDPHNFLKGLHQQHAEDYEQAFNSFKEKYKV